VSNDDLRQIEARHAAASPGPWKCKHPADMTRASSSGAIPSIVYPNSEGYPLAHCYGGNFGDTDFITAAWDDVRRLVAEVERLRVAIQALEVGI
jgi:hypothetical protein